MALSPGGRPVDALEPARTGPRPKERNPLAGEMKRLQKEKQALERRLKRAELLLEISKKGCGADGDRLDQQLRDDESE